MPEFVLEGQVREVNWTVSVPISFRGRTMQRLRRKKRIELKCCTVVESFDILKCLAVFPCIIGCFSSWPSYQPPFVFVIGEIMIGNLFNDVFVCLLCRYVKWGDIVRIKVERLQM